MVAQLFKKIFRGRHKYEYAVDLNADTAAAKLVRMLGTEKRVLEIGAGPGSITRLIHGANNCRVTAIEIDSEAVKKLSPFCEKVYQQDLNDPAWVEVVSENGKFDVVVAADVLEHLYDPWTSLRLMKTVLGENGCVVVSLPHVGHNAVMSCLLNADFRYQEWGLLDKTHIRFFGITNIQALFREAGLKIVRAEFVVRSPEQTEFAGYWRKLSEDTKRVLAANPYGNVYQVVVRAVPHTSLETEIQLSSIVVPEIGSGFSDKATVKTRLVEMLKSQARARFSLRAYYRIANFLATIGVRL
jgi:2-polyprenyl-3-methyl-5-hydroxy-6-metoxy-1,4-benzoquinol methylase